MPNPDRFDINFFKPRTKEEREALAKNGYFELKERALDYLNSHRQALPQGLNLDEVRFWFERGVASLVYAERFMGDEINDVGIFFKTKDSANGVLIPLGIYKPIFPPVEISIVEILKKYEPPIQVQRWKDRAKQRK